MPQDECNKKNKDVHCSPGVLLPGDCVLARDLKPRGKTKLMDLRKVIPYPVWQSVGVRNYVWSRAGMHQGEEYALLQLSSPQSRSSRDWTNWGSIHLKTREGCWEPLRLPLDQPKTYSQLWSQGGLDFGVVMAMKESDLNPSASSFVHDITEDHPLKDPPSRDSPLRDSHSPTAGTSPAASSRILLELDMQEDNPPPSEKDPLPPFVEENTNTCTTDHAMPVNYHNQWKQNNAIQSCKLPTADCLICIPCHPRRSRVIILGNTG